MGEPTQAPRFESRWPVGLAVLAVSILVAVLPERVRLFPFWFPYVAGSAVLAALAAVGLSHARTRWLRVERAITLLFFVVVEAGVLVGLAYLIDEMVRPSAGIGGVQLLASSIVLWVGSILAFSLLYWQIDRGGPEARVNEAGSKPDWFFPQDGAPQAVPPDWQPTFADYLFLSFTTATAFSPTDTLPLTSRAKLLMMVESSISLVTIVVVGARAINILGS